MKFRFFGLHLFFVSLILNLFAFETIAGGKASNQSPFREADIRPYGGAFPFPQKVNHLAPKPLSVQGDYAVDSDGFLGSIERVLPNGTLVFKYFKNDHYYTDERHPSTLHVCKYTGNAESDPQIDPRTQSLPSSEPSLNEPSVANSNDDRTCVICLDRDRVVVYLPCRHLATCSECAEAKGTENCPSCQIPTVQQITVFHP